MNPKRSPYRVQPVTAAPAKINVCGPIQRRRDLCLGYAGRGRLVRPAVHGHNAAGVELLLAFQVSPDRDPGWRVFRVDEIQVIDELQVPLLIRGLDLSVASAADFEEVHCALAGFGLRPA